MYCRKCGQEIADDSNVCPYCGERVVFADSEARPTYNQTNGMAIAGFITAFISPIFGLIFGIIGLKRSNAGYGGRMMSIFAILIASANIILGVYLVLSGKYDELLKQYLN